MKGRRSSLRWLMALAISVVASLLIGATTANGAGIHHVTLDELQVDAYTPNTVLHLYGFKYVDVWQPSGGVTNETVFYLQLGGTDENGSWWADCAQPPADVMTFGPLPTEGSIIGTFQCTKLDGTTFPVTVNVKWTGQLGDLQRSGYPYYPAGAPGAFAGLGFWSEVTGTVSDGTTEFLPPGVTDGYIWHVSDTIVSR